MQITFVCSGNTCRSPLALAAWQVELREMAPACRKKLEQFEVRCAGLHARTGARVSARAQFLAASWNVDLIGHRAQVWRPNGTGDEMLIAMTREQAAQIRFRLGVAPSPDASRIVTLGSFDAATAPAWSESPDAESSNDESRFDIPDPYGGSSEAYEECGARIRRGVRALARSLCRQ